MYLHISTRCILRSGIAISQNEQMLNFSGYCKLLSLELIFVVWRLDIFSIPSCFECNAFFSNIMPLSSTQFISCLATFIVLHFQKDFSLIASYTFEYFAGITLVLCMYKEFLLSPSHGERMEGIVWLSKSRKTGNSLFVKLGWFGFKIISTYFPESLVPLFLAGRQWLSLSGEYSLLGKPQNCMLGCVPTDRRKTL